MSEIKILVSDHLLRELSAETRKIGSKVQVRATEHHPSFIADVADVIILPHSEFYRAKFMVYYKIYTQNSVKALKELSKTFPFIPDLELGIGYVLNIEQAPEAVYNPIKIKNEFDWLNTTTLQQATVVRSKA